MRVIDQSGDNHHHNYEFDYSKAVGQGNRVTDESVNDRGLHFAPTSKHRLLLSQVFDDGYLHMVDDVMQFIVTT